MENIKVLIYNKLFSCINYYFSSLKKQRPLLQNLKTLEQIANECSIFKPTETIKKQGKEMEYWLEIGKTNKKGISLDCF